MRQLSVDALTAIECDSPHFFWTGNSLRRSGVADWQRAVRRQFEIAEYCSRWIKARRVRQLWGSASQCSIRWISQRGYQSHGTTVRLESLAVAAR